jgi:short-subunit dehydrogenase
VRVAVEPADLSAPGGAAALCDVLLARELDIDLLIANAGFGTGGAFLDAKCESQAEMVRVNCEALVVLTHRLLPAMVARRQGAIVHVASIAAMQPIPFMATYGATKAFVLSFSQAVSEEVRPSGVRVLALCPGPVRTEFQAVAGMDIAPSQKAAILSSEETVRLGLRALEEDAGVYVPGAVNRLGQLGARLLPRRVKLRVVSRIMRDKGRSSSSS